MSTVSPIQKFFRATAVGSALRQARNAVLWPALKLRVAAAGRSYAARPSAISAVRLGKALLSADRVEEAVAHTSSARRQFPGSSELSSLLATSRRRKALGELRKALAGLRAQRTVAAHLHVAGLYRTLGDFQKGLQWLERVNFSFPDHWLIHYAYGQLYYARYQATKHPSDISTCLQHLDKSANLSKSHPKVLTFLAFTHAKIGNHGEAYHYIDSILGQDPQCSQALSLKAHLDAEAAARMQASEMGATQSLESLPPDARQYVSEAFDSFEQHSSKIALFALTDSGTILNSSTHQNSHFDFSEAGRVVRDLATTCKTDAARMGMGNISSCIVEGDGWVVAVRSTHGVDLVAFLSNGGSAQFTEESLDAILTPAAAAHR